MSLKASNFEIQERLFRIKEKMELDNNDLNIISSVIDNDIYALSIILNDEGAMIALQNEIDNIKKHFLNEYTNDYEVFKKYYNNDVSEWVFLSKDQKELLRNLKKSQINLIQKYYEDRGDLMIYRKTINSFIVSKLKNKESLEDLKEVRSYLLNNYSYYDTLLQLGLDPDINEDGFVKLNKLVLDDNGLYKKS